MVEYICNSEPEGSAVSLQSLIMIRNDSDRGPKISEQIYQPGVLESNWLEDSARVLPSTKDEWATLCETSYRPCKTELLIRPKFEAWEQRILTQGIGARLMIDHYGMKYRTKWTSHDLNFEILPKGHCGPWLREFNASNKEWLSAQDYDKIYGNLTEYGFTDLMRYKWSIKNGSIRPWQTNYQHDYPKYENASSVR